MPNLYDRAFRLTAYDKDGNVCAIIDKDVANAASLRIVFHVTQMTSMINNIAEFSIYNCSLSTRTKLLRSTYISFQAGYVGNLKLIFKGRVMNLFDQRPQPDVVHTIYALDQFNQSIPCNVIIPAKATDREAIKIISGLVPEWIVMDSHLHDLTDKPIGKAVSILNLNAWQGMLKLGELFDLNFFVINSQLYSSSRVNGKPPEDSEKIIINYRTGMIESPVFDVANAGVNVKTLLDGQLIPGSDVVIETVNPQVQFGAVNYANFEQAAFTRGTWRIFQADHLGDTRGNDWYTEIQGYSYQTTLAGVIPSNE